ncbi:hypothetical protein FY137_11925 [Agrobacterium tumefaciens]|nr:hypothetical protein FY137_11925 [Agrobacterium tumefaciens]
MKIDIGKFLCSEGVQLSGCGQRDALHEGEKRRAVDIEENALPPFLIIPAAQGFFRRQVSEHEQ